ncbi:MULTISPECIES: hypothetical protein [unclassified Moorena]|uniref:hypothetical protein n=1 Tax=unclassified Moorena TaxID=2683338 RepID=UPI0013FF24C5|nr:MULTISPECIES: hypothetical protein [unclassified Moorena]NEO15761.1 hypothetical protein [Moorena sp. SIO3E8]NEQ02208.1 hypothetical protein [Moorena sp. SIO3F7]
MQRSLGGFQASCSPHFPHFSIFPDSRLPTPDSRLPTPDSRLPTPNSQLPTPNSLLRQDV